jgi:hypothetical protein
LSRKIPVVFCNAFNGSSSFICTFVNHSGNFFFVTAGRRHGVD